MSDLKDRIYHLIGSPFEVGIAMGQLLGPKLEANIDHYCQARVTGGVSLDLARWRVGALPWLRTLPARFQEEFEGLAQGAGVTLQRVAEWEYLEVILAGQCSGAIVTLDGKVWVARNNDIFAPELWGYATIREVTDRIPTISFGLEGDVFTPTGINREKLWLHYNYLPAWDAPAAEKPHLPCYAFMVEALETCCTLREVESLLDRLQRDESMLLFAVDGKTNDFALYECGCMDFCKRKAAQNWLVGTNHCSAHPQAPAPQGSGPHSSLSRYKRLETLVAGLASQPKCPSPAEELVGILADEGVEVREGEIVTAYSNVACPATGEVWYTFGGYPAASQGNWQQLEWSW
jgi:hypothetical protein